MPLISWTNHRGSEQVLHPTWGLLDTSTVLKGLFGEMQGGSQVVSINRFPFKDVLMDIIFYAVTIKICIKNHSVGVNTKKWAYLVNWATSYKVVIAGGLIWHQ
jgi:hypothetical protein